ncbi:hypothetical protein WJX82_000201 [Trebouxia sp. C0006]
MASLPAIAEGPTAEEQMLMAEASSVSRQTDLQTLRHDKREFIKANRRALAKTPKFGETFGQVQSSDLPPQFRALLEDNRMLHEQVRTYKRELYEAQASNTANSRHVVRLQAEAKRMHEALQSCSRSPDEVNAERNAARLIQQQEEDSQKLRDRVSVLAHAKETDARRFKQIAVERQREREDLTREVDRLKSLVAERDKAFRAQAFSLKQLNTRVVQLQHQQTEQASREAALLQELSLGSLEGQSSTVESLVAASDHGSMSTLKRGQSRLPPGMETMRRRLEPIMSSETAMQDSSLAVGQSEDEEDLEEEAAVKLMLVVLGQDAIQGFYQQVARERKAAGSVERGDADEAAILIQSAWRMKLAQQELVRLRQAQAEAASSQAVQERQNSLVSPGRALANRGTMRRPSTKPIKGFQPPQDAIQGFYQQVARERKAAGSVERGDADEAAILIQSAWRMKLAQQELVRLRQAQAEAASSQAVQERQNSLVSPGRALANRGTMRRPSTKPIKGFQPPQAESGPKSPRRKATRTSTGLVAPNSPSARSPTNGVAAGKERTSTSPLMPSPVAGQDDGSRGSQGPSRRNSIIKKPDSFLS